MAKTYVSATKYTIYMRFEINGVVDKPDIIGAIFGQSEGLLGEEMDLRELQKGGKIGRIEIEHFVKNGKTVGQVIIPSGLDMVETCILAAALETVEKVGPCEAKFKVQSIEDTRMAKRKQIVERAKELYRKILETQVPDPHELAEKVREEARAAEICYYANEIPCGPDVETADEIIVVEGRADVLNLLRHGIKNVISMGGSKIHPAVVELCKKKTTIAFIDGDRGGELDLRKLAQLTKVDYVARAPAGKEVEELTQKEIVQALRKKVPYAKKTKQISQEDKKLLEMLEQLKGTLKAKLLDKDFNTIAEVPVRELLKSLKGKTIHAIVFDGIVTKRVLEEAEAHNISIVAGIKKGKFPPSKKVKVIILEEA
ncbi:MAG: DNA primase [Candidatus Iainarchaeum archaeon]|uniref:DNA primase DnaG n=1 Tax=Candidatus Iainarchaeum sp. TaxID=3101447 RepID=A0A497JKN0_9ARCH|nr:MAG: DNA primase [Candidatus Diapherotrites archaeon]